MNHTGLLNSQLMGDLMPRNFCPCLSIVTNGKWVVMNVKEMMMNSRWKMKNELWMEMNG